MTQRKRRILLLDRDPKACGQLAGPLAAAGYELHLVEDSEAARALEESGPFDAVIAEAALVETLLDANVRLEQANSRLVDELKAAARVQQALLPAEPGPEMRRESLSFHSVCPFARSCSFSWLWTLLRSRLV